MMVNPGGAPRPFALTTPPSENQPVQEFEQLKQLVHEAEEDLRKAEGGNKAAGTRARKAMQDIKNLAQDVRKKILELRSDDAAA